MMNRPLIGIVTNLSGDPDLSERCKNATFTNSYIMSVAMSGGLPIGIPPLTDGEAIDEIIQKIDGLLVPGGNDMSPQLYGEEPCQNQGSFSLDRDFLDLQSIRTAHRMGKPILGICRGIQAINVCFGGTLYQDLKQEEQFTVKHYQDGKFCSPSHMVNLQPDGMLFPELGKEILVNSFHHQAVKRIADGFRAIAFSKDGVIEAMESEKGSFVLGVQWHPEQMTANGDKKMKKIFELFIHACKTDK